MESENIVKMQIECIHGQHTFIYYEEDDIKFKGYYA